MQIQIIFDPDNPDDTAKAVAFMNTQAYLTGAAAAVAIPAPVAAVAAVAPAPSAPVAVTPQHDLTDLDANGHPHDERIHQKAKGKTAKNVWKVTKGLDKGLLEQVKAELSAAYPLATAPASPAATPPAAPAVTPPVAPAPTQAAPTLVPAHQEIVDKIQAIIEQHPVPTVGAHEHWSMDASLDLGPSIGECMLKFKCANVDEVGDLTPVEMDSLLAGLNYIWPTQ